MGCCQELVQEDAVEDSGMKHPIKQETKQNEKQQKKKKNHFAYFSLRFDSLLAFGRCLLIFSLAAASLLDVSDVGVSSDSTCSKLIFLSGDVFFDVPAISWGLSIGVVIIEWSLLMIMVSSFSMAAALSRSMFLLLQFFYHNFEFFSHQNKMKKFSFWSRKKRFDFVIMKKSGTEVLRDDDRVINLQEGWLQGEILHKILLSLERDLRHKLVHAGG